MSSAVQVVLSPVVGFFFQLCGWFFCFVFFLFVYFLPCSELTDLNDTLLVLNNSPLRE